MSSIRLDPNVILCLPLALLPSIFPRNTSFSKASCLSMCPKTFNCLFLTSAINSLLTPASSITLSFVILAVHGILSILLRNHISAASTRLLSSLFNVHASQPYNRTDQTKHFSILSLIFMLRFMFVRTFLMLLKLVFAIPILFLTSVPHLPSSVTITPRYL